MQSSTMMYTIFAFEKNPFWCSVQHTSFPYKNTKPRLSQSLALTEPTSNCFQLGTIPVHIWRPHLHTTSKLFEEKELVLAPEQDTAIYYYFFVQNLPTYLPIYSKTFLLVTFVRISGPVGEETNKEPSPNHSLQ